MELKKGIKGEVEITVAREYTALEAGSGGVPVLATPMLVLLMEKAAIEALEGRVDQGQTTVGTALNIKHLAATPIGMKVRALARLEKVYLPRLFFRVEAFDEEEKVGEGEHQRFVIDRERFMEKVEAKGS